MKEIINREEYEKMLEKNSNFAIIFIQQSCGFCKNLLKSLKEKKCDTKNIYFLDVHSSLGDYVYYRKHAHLKLFYPYTRVYKNGNISLELNGMLYDTQIEELYKELEI